MPKINLPKFKKLSLKGGNKYPTKTTINLLYKENHTQENIFSVFCLLIFFVFLYFFVTRYVMVQLGRADAAEQKYEKAATELREAQDFNADYDRILQDYSHYGNGYLNEQEAAEQDRVTMLNVIDDKIHTIGGIQNISISDNVATVSLEVAGAEKLPPLISTLQSSEYVQYVTAQTAGTVDNNNKAPIQVVQPDGSVITTNTLVKAILTIYFRSPSEVDAALSNGEADPQDAHLDAKINAVGDDAYVPAIVPQAVTESLQAAGNAASSAVNSATSAIQQAAAQQAAAQQAAQQAASKAQEEAQAKAKAQAAAQQAAAQKAAAQAAAQQAAAQQAAAQAAAQQAAQQTQAASVPTKGADIQTPAGAANTDILDLQSGRQPF